MLIRARTTACASLAALAALVSLTGCGSRDDVEDAPALLGTAIPAAPPSAKGVDLPSALVTRSGTGTPTRGKVPPAVPPHTLPPDPFATPAPKPTPAPPATTGGVQL